MKKVLLFAVSALIIFGLSSCDKKAKNLDDLKKKYDKKEFKDCDEFLVASQEMMDVYFATIEKAADGDENAKTDFEGIEEFLGQFDEQHEKFAEECPEKFEEFEKKLESKMEELMPKILKMYGLDGLFDGMDDDMDWDQDYDLEDSIDEVAEEITE
ncbi:MAG: hypothetical protein M0Q45_05215 [Bacteroidales bacterium]|nr:hypothetical protein [Bacteroidales bacterium]MDY0315257.1 hypothetical protein [Bacteroidales bacterium]